MPIIFFPIFYSFVFLYLIHFLTLYKTTQSYTTFFIIFTQYHHWINQNNSIQEDSNLLSVSARMYITVPLKKNKNRKYQQKHQQSIIKQIQYNAIFQNIKLNDSLSKSNGFIKTKHKILTDKQNTLSPIINNNTCLTLRNLSNQKHQKYLHRPSVSQMFNQKSQNNHQNQLKFKQTLPSNHSNSNKKVFFKTTGEFFKKRIIQNQTIEQRPQQRFSKLKQTQQNKSSKKALREKYSQSVDQSMLNGREQRKTLSLKKHNLTLLDLKLQDIQNVVNKAGKTYAIDFVSQVQKDHKATRVSCWKKFFNDVSRDSSKNLTKIQQKVQKLRRTATSHKKSLLKPQNYIQQLFASQGNNIPNSNSSCQTLQTQKMHTFLNLVTDCHFSNQFTTKISLRQYNKLLPKFYILKNLSEAIKSSEQYKKMTMQGFKEYNKAEMLAFIYLNENQYKLKVKGNEMKDVVP